MPSFAIRHPYLIIVFCLVVIVLGLIQTTSDSFPFRHSAYRRAASLSQYSGKW